MKIKNPDSFSILIAAVAVCLTIGMIVLTGRKENGEDKTIDEGLFTENETSLIMNSDSVMRVLTIYDKSDSLLLREKASDLSRQALSSETFRNLAGKMLVTVQAPEYDGVGIAAPQVGISRNVIAVCRVDKEGEPFEIYPNARIDSLFGPVTHGPEGCLSIPGMRGNVGRYSSVIVSYNDPATFIERKDTVNGYAAIIFQHECDHLNGILYTDKADSLVITCN